MSSSLTLPMHWTRSVTISHRPHQQLLDTGKELLAFKNFLFLLNQLRSNALTFLLHSGYDQG